MREKMVQVKRRGGGNWEKRGSERGVRWEESTIPFQIASEAERGGMERDKRRAGCACLAERETFLCLWATESLSHNCSNTTSTFHRVLQNNTLYGAALPLPQGFFLGFNRVLQWSNVYRYMVFKYTHYSVRGGKNCFHGGEKFRLSSQGSETSVSNIISNITALRI